MTRPAKHSFAGDLGGNIIIKFSKSDSKYVLQVLNDGVQIPSDVLERKTGLGVSLVKTFVKQLGGKLSVDPENGFRATF